MGMEKKGVGYACGDGRVQGGNEITCKNTED